jgi:hypothetical protein
VIRKIVQVGFELFKILPRWHWYEQIFASASHGRSILQLVGITVSRASVRTSVFQP